MTVFLEFFCVSYDNFLLLFLSSVFKWLPSIYRCKFFATWRYMWLYILFIDYELYIIFIFYLFYLLGG